MRDGVLNMTLRGVFRCLSNIHNGAKIVFAETIFRKRFHHRHGFEGTRNVPSPQRKFF